METQAAQSNPLGTESIPGLMLKYAIPSVVSMLVMALYNIVDQIFIGRGVGFLGNAATTVAFPLITIGLALALLMGNGAAAHISLELGRGKSGEAKRTLGSALFMLACMSIAVVLLTFLFLEPLLRLFGATDAVMPYAIDYTRPILVGLPFSMMATAISSVIRADGSPRFSMFCTLAGAVLNTILDPIYIFVFHMGARGAAIATAISQIVSFLLAVYYLLRRAKYVRLGLNDLAPDFRLIRKIMGLGSSSFVNQISMFLVQLVINRSLTYYGTLSPYGGDIPLAAVGIVMKINAILISAILGVAIGLQPIFGFNYGAGNYDRVKRTYRNEIIVTGLLAACVNVLFLLTPETFIAIFGDENAMFNEFAAHALRIFMCCVFAAGVQIPSSIFFMAIGMPLKSMLFAMTRQIFALIPLVLVLPLVFGLNGILYAGPSADVIALCVTLMFVVKEMRSMGHAAAPSGAPQELREPL